MKQKHHAPWLRKFVVLSRMFVASLDDWMLRKAGRRENGDQRRFNLPPDPKLPVLAPPPNGFVVVEGFPKPAPKPIQPGSHVRVRTRLK